MSELRQNRTIVSAVAVGCSVIADVATVNGFFNAVVVIFWWWSLIFNIVYSFTQVSGLRISRQTLYIQTSKIRISKHSLDFQTFCPDFEAWLDFRTFCPDIKGCFNYRAFILLFPDFCPDIEACFSYRAFVLRYPDFLSGYRGIRISRHPDIEASGYWTIIFHASKSGYP